MAVMAQCYQIVGRIIPLFKRGSASIPVNVMDTKPCSTPTELASIIIAFQNSRKAIVALFCRFVAGLLPAIIAGSSWFTMPSISYINWSAAFITTTFTIHTQSPMSKRLLECQVEATMVIGHTLSRSPIFWSPIRKRSRCAQHHAKLHVGTHAVHLWPA